MTPLGHQRVAAAWLVGDAGGRCSKPLIIVAHRCGAGHRVTFTSQGGYNPHEGTWQVTSIHHECSAHRLVVESLGPQASGLRWSDLQGLLACKHCKVEVSPEGSATWRYLKVMFNCD